MWNGPRNRSVCMWGGMWGVGGGGDGGRGEGVSHVYVSATVRVGGGGGCTMWNRLRKARISALAVKSWFSRRALFQTQPLSTFISECNIFFTLSLSLSLPPPPSPPHTFSSSSLILSRHPLLDKESSRN